MKQRTLQEIADFFGCWVAIDESRLMVYGYHSKPKLGSDSFYGEFIGGVGHLEIISDLPEDWKDSVTGPKEPPFKEGEVIVNIELGFPSMWRKEFDLHADEYRRPTEAEWKVLRGEE